MSFYKNIFIFLFGCAFASLLGYFILNFNKKEANVINKDYYILNNQISKMNKMLVLEQNFSSFQTHKSSAINLGGFEILSKEMVLYTTAKAQVSYDLKKLKINIDSINKRLIIKEIPNAEIKVFPETKIHFMDDSIVNKFSKEELNSIMESAKKNITKKVNHSKLEAEAKEQLISNLSDIFVLAKYLNYTIEDETKELNDIL